MVTTITMTSIATTIITTTITPMLMTTNEPAPADARQRDDGGRGGGAVPADDLAVAGLSGRRVLLFQRHRMGGRGRRYHDAASLRDWLAAMLADGSGFCDGVFLAHAHRAASRGDDAALARDRRTRRRLRALARTPAGNHGAGPRLHRDRARGLDLRRARRADRRLRRRDRLSRRGRPRQRRARDPACADAACVPACAWCRTGFPPARG